MCFKFACLVVWVVLGGRLFDCFGCRGCLFGLVVVYGLCCVVLVLLGNLHVNSVVVFVS